jgi:hypothetical protein
MDENKRKFGVGELLFVLVVILGIIGTVSFFAFEEYLGEYQAAFMIASSLAFIASFFALSVYARAKKRSHLRRVSVDRALSNWIDFAGSIGSSGGKKQLPAGTLESIVVHIFTMDGYRLVPGKADGYVRLLNKDGKVELILCRPEPLILGMRDVIAFYEVFHTEKAAWGEIWSPGGFSTDAENWVGKRPITLRNANDIHQVVESLLQKRQTAQSKK